MYYHYIYTCMEHPCNIIHVYEHTYVHMLHVHVLVYSKKSVKVSVNLLHSVSLDTRVLGIFHIHQL